MGENQDRQFVWALGAMLDRAFRILSHGNEEPWKCFRFPFQIDYNTSSDSLLYNTKNST